MDRNNENSFSLTSSHAHFISSHLISALPTPPTVFLSPTSIFIPLSLLSRSLSSFALARTFPIFRQLKLSISLFHIPRSFLPAGPVPTCLPTPPPHFQYSLLEPMKDLFGGFFRAEYTYLFCKLFLFTKQTIYVDGYIF